MKFTPKRIFGAYFNSWWLPAAAFMLVFAVFTAAARLPQWRPVAALGDFLLVASDIGLLGIFAAAIWNLGKKRWVNGLVNLILLPMCSALAAHTIRVLVFASI